MGGTIETSLNRKTCWSCYQPQSFCFCSQLTALDVGIRFVILTHPLEYRKRMATGRMTHLSLKHSRLVVGSEFSQSKEVNDLLGDQDYLSFLLYPGENAIDIQNNSQLQTLLKPQKLKLQIFVIDGTWATSRKTLRLSPNLAVIPRIAFEAQAASRFRVRKQPKNFCWSTVEAVHHCIERLGRLADFDLKTRSHDQMLNCFEELVEAQLNFDPRFNNNCS